jgi:hypothetical protein
MVAADASPSMVNTPISIFGNQYLVYPQCGAQPSELLWKALCQKNIPHERLSALTGVLNEHPQFDIGLKCLFTSLYGLRIQMHPDASALTVATFLGDEQAVKVMMWRKGHRKAAQETLFALQSYVNSRKRQMSVGTTDDERLDAVKKILQGEVDPDDQLVQLLARYHHSRANAERHLENIENTFNRELSALCNDEVQC